MSFNRIKQNRLVFFQKYLFFVLFFFYVQNVYSQLKITSYSPTSGAAGKAVNIVGTGFSTSITNNIVFFGATKAIINTATSTSLNVTVPTGASYSPISVTTGNFTAYSSKSFIPTFSGGGTLDAHSFAPQIDSVTGITPYSSAIGDFDGDGRADVAIINGGYPYSLSIFRNKGEANHISFDAPVNIPTGIAPFDIAVADINGDGKSDIIITNSGIGSNAVEIYKNTSQPGKVSFILSAKSNAGTDPTSLAITDLDGDGRPDIVVANFSSANISVFMNSSLNGNITVNAQVVLSTQANPAFVRLGDIDGDGKPDIAVGTSGSNMINIFRNISSPGLLTLTPVTVNFGKNGLSFQAQGDIDADGKPDMVFVGSGDTVSISLNKSVPGTIEFATSKKFPLTSRPARINIGDLDGDGKIDIAIASGETNEIFLLHNKSVPGTADFGASTSLSTSSSAFSINSNDLDGDGKSELITTNIEKNTFSVFKNTVNGPGILSFTPTYGGTDSTVFIKGFRLSTVTEVQFGGVNAKSFRIVSDTLIAATVGKGKSGNIIVKTKNEEAVLSGFQYYPPPVIQSLTPSSGSGDSVILITGKYLSSTFKVEFGGTPAASFIVNSDSSISATVGAGASGTVSVRTRGGAGSLSGFVYTGIRPVITSFSPQSGAINTVVIILGTGFDPNPLFNFVFFGSVRAKVTSATTTMLTVIVPSGASFLPISVTNGNHLTGFSNKPFSVTFPQYGQSFNENAFGKQSVLAGSGTSPISVYSSDFDGDGKPDLVLANKGSTQGSDHSVSIYQNTGSPGDISFSLALNFPQKGSFFMSAVTVADFNGDGKPDFAVAGGGISQVLIYINFSTPGKFQFLAPVSLPLPVEGTNEMIVADFDDDGKTDIALTSTYTYVFAVLRNKSTVNQVTFSDAILFPTGNNPQGLATADLDGDGHIDLVVTNVGLTDNSLSIYRNIGDFGKIAFDQPVKWIAGTNIFNHSATVADLNGDGKSEIIASANTGNVSVLPNNSSPGHLSFGTNVDFPGARGYVIPGNLDGDGKPDLTVTDFYGLVNIRNISSPTQLSLESPIRIYNPFSVSSGCVEDLDGDGLPDIAYTNTGRNNLVMDQLVFIVRNQLNNTNEPTIISASPDTANLGSTIVLKGWHLTGATGVSFGSVPAGSFKVVNDSMVTAVVGKGASGKIKVSFPKFTASKDSFVYQGPIIKSFSPDTLRAAGQVLIYGLNLNHVLSITFGGVPAASFLIGENVINCVVKTGASGNIVVTTTYGKDSISGFVFIPADTQLPHIKSFSPESAKSNTAVRIVGSHFTGATSVSFGTFPASSFQVIKDTIINAVVGKGSSGYLKVITPQGADSLAGFKYITDNSSPFTAISITPASGTAGTQVSIKGSSLSNVNSIVIPALANSSYRIVSDSVINLTIGSSNTTGNVNIFLYSSSDTVKMVFKYQINESFKLLGFEGIAKDNFILLKWTAINEQAVERYNLQRSDDSLLFVTIGSIPSLSTVGPNDYNFRDTLRLTGNSKIVWYRLQIISASQVSFYSPKVLVGFKSPLKIYPNPSNGILNVVIPNTSANSTISILDAGGRVLLVFNIDPLMSEKVLNLKGLLPGMYYLKWTDGKSKFVRGFFIN